MQSTLDPETASNRLLRVKASRQIATLIESSMTVSNCSSIAVDNLDLIQIRGTASVPTTVVQSQRDGTILYPMTVSSNLQVYTSKMNPLSNGVPCEITAGTHQHVVTNVDHLSSTPIPLTEMESLTNETHSSGPKFVPKRPVATAPVP